MAIEQRQADYIVTCTLEFPDGTTLDLGPADEKSGGGIARASTPHRSATDGKLKRIPGLAVPGEMVLTYAHTGQEMARLKRAIKASGAVQERDQNRNPIRQPEPYTGTVDEVGDPETNVDGAEVGKFTVTIAVNER